MRKLLRKGVKVLRELTGLSFLILQEAFVLAEDVLESVEKGLEGE